LVLLLRIAHLVYAACLPRHFIIVSLQPSLSIGAFPQAPGPRFGASPFAGRNDGWQDRFPDFADIACAQSDEMHDGNGAVEVWVWTTELMRIQSHGDLSFG
jgi:hypothetical protein